jgi:acyl-CoA thioesterase FadM
LVRGLDDRLPSVEAARLTNAAARMMRVYQEAFLTLQKIRTGGKQTVVVQHVQVSDGGQAVVAGHCSFCLVNKKESRLRHGR